MIENEKTGFMDVIKNGLSYVSQIVSAGIFPKIEEGTEMVMNNIEKRIMLVEKRILRKLSSILIIGFGGVFLAFALFSYFGEFLGWSDTAAFFSIGMTVFVLGLLLKIRGSDE